jgi:hypothetical protein
VKVIVMALDPLKKTYSELKERSFVDLADKSII